jgi:hypothetical protein
VEIAPAITINERNGAGESWYDVSSWFRAALLKRSNGPWWAVTIATPI